MALREANVEPARPDTHTTEPVYSGKDIALGISVQLSIGEKRGIGVQTHVTRDCPPEELNNILNDQMIASAPVASKQWGGGYAQQGTLVIPNRGVLKCLPGDFIGFDVTTGWPILVSAAAAATGAIWVHT